MSEENMKTMKKKIEERVGTEDVKISIGGNSNARESEKGNKRQTENAKGKFLCKLVEEMIKLEQRRR